MGTYDIFKKRYAKEQTVKPASSASKKTEKVETAKPEAVEPEKQSSGLRSLDYFYNHTKAPGPVKANTLESLSTSVTPMAGIVHGGRGRSFGMQRPVTAEASNEPARKQTVRPEFADQGISNSRGDTQILTGEPYNLTREGQWAAKHPIAGTLMYGVSNLVGGAEGFINTGEAALRALATGQKFNPNNIHAAPIAQGFRTGAAEGVRRNIQENTPGFASAVGIDSRDGRYTFGEKAADFLSGVGADAVSSSISMATGGPLSTALMGGSAANQNLYETSQDENTTARQAAALATANGIAEAFFEHFSVERLLNFRNPTSTAQAIRAALVQAGVEASEEMFTEIANTLSDIAIRRDYSERGREYQDYIKQGMTPNTAATNTMRSAVTQIFLAGLGGALSGGLHTGAAIAGNTFTGGRNMRTDIRNGITLEDIAGSIDTSTAEGQRVKDIANDIAQREAAGRTASTAELGYLSNAIANAADVAEENEAKAAASQTAPVEDVASETTPQENIPERRAVTQMMNDVAAETAKDTGEAFRNANYYNSQRMTAGERIFNAEMAEDMASTFGEEGQKAFSALPAEEGVKAYREWAAHYNNMRFGMPIREGMSTTLSPEQISAAMRAGALDANRAYPQDTMKAVNRAVNKISVNGVNAGNTDLSGIDYKSLTPQQKLRVDYTSTFITKGLGMDVRYVKSEAVDGRYKGMNGSFQVINGRPTITLDVNAGMNRESDWTGDITDIKSMLPVISHETTHFLEQYNPKLYKELSNTVLTALQNNGTYSKGMTINSIIEAERQRLNDTIKDEDGKPVQHTQDDAIHELVARACEDMLSGDKKALDAFNSLDAQTKQTLWDHVKQVFDNIREFFAQMLSSYKSDSAEAKAIRQNMEEFEKIRSMWMDALDGSHAEDIGINIDTATESAAPTGPELSYRSWNASDWVQYKKEAAKELADALGVSTKTATKYINDVNSVAKMIFDDQVRLDYDSSEGRSAFVSNTEYGGSIDFSTLCKKRLLYTGTIQAIQNLLPNTALTPAEYLQIRQMMLDAGHEVTCGLCYVEGSRVKMGVYTKEFIEKYKKTNPEYVPTMAEMNTPDGQEKLRSEHPEVYDAYVYFMNHYGTLSKGEKALFASQQKPKLYTLRTEYKGEIKKKFGGAKNRASVADKNLNGGLRIQSFSDFEIVHMIDMMQVIMDMSEAGLAGQAYTKVPEFADSFGRTGLKINCSLITKGVDENGKLIFDDREGMSHERAFELRDKYSKNVGTVLVVFNQEQLRAALADDRIDYVLPFHKSQWTSEQYDAIGLPEGTIDFTNYQNDYIKGAKSKENVMPMEYWDFSKSGRENAERYLQICAEEGRTPKFARIRGENLLIDNGDGTWSLPEGPLGDGYFKLLIDFKMYDNNGKGARQMPVRPNFSMDEIRTALNDYKGGHRSFPVANDIVQKFVDNYKKQNPRAEYSTRDIEEAADSEDRTDVIRQGSDKDIQFSTRIADKNLDNRLRVNMATFFSGTGTVDFALRNIVRHEFAVEYDAKIAAVYRANNGDNIYVDDVRNVNIDSHKGKVEYFHASPVCKSYSNANNDMGETPLDIETARATADAIRNLEPKVVTVENVARYRNSEAVKIIEEALEESGYDYDVKVYSATDFGGATIRQRMFIRAVKDGVLPEVDTSEHARSWYSVVEDLIPELPPAKLSNYMEERLEPSGIDIDNLEQPVFVLGGEKSGKLTYATADKPAPTLLAKSTEAKILMPDGRVLRATPRVMARIQGLPDGFDLMEKEQGITNAYKIVGNGVPVQLTQGIVGPLLEENLIRQKSEATGVQYSTRAQELDSEYQDALDAKNEDWQLMLVDQAAYEAGYTTTAYHGSPFTDINVFNTRSQVTKKTPMQLLFGTHFTQSLDYAKLYAQKAKNSKGTSRMTTKTGRVYKTYLDLGKSLDLRTPANITPGTDEYKLYEDAPAKYKKKYPPYTFSKYDTEQGLGSGQYITKATIENVLQAMSPKDATDFLIDHGYNSVLYDANYATPTTGNNRFTRDPSIIMLDPERIKSGDPVTYDDNGNVIPLSERFNSENEDIRYSQRNANISEAIEKRQRRMEERYLARIDRLTAKSDEKIDKLKTKMRNAVGAEKQKARDRLDKLRKEKNDKIKHLEKAYRLNLDWRIAEMRQEMENAVGAEKQKAMERLDVLRTQKNQQIDDIISEYRETRLRERLKRRESKAQQELLRRARRLAGMKGDPDFRAQVDALIGDLDLVAAGIRDDTKKKLEEIRKQVEAQSELDPDYAKYEAPKYAKLLERPNKKHISQMSIEDIIQLTESIVALEHSKRTADHEIGKERRATFGYYGKVATEQLEKTKGINYKNEIGVQLGKYKLNMLNPTRAFSLIDGYQRGGVFTYFGKELNDGQTKAAQFRMEVEKMFHDIDQNKNLVDDFAKQDIEIDTLEGKKKISKGMRIALYLHLQNPDNVKHIAFGGITIPNERLYSRGKYAEAYAAGETVHLSEWDPSVLGESVSDTVNRKNDAAAAAAIRKITDQMTPEEKEYAEIAYKFFNETTKDAINEVSLALNGYEKAIVDDYFQISTNKNFLQSSYDGLVKDGTLEGMGMLKERSGSRLPIYLEDASQVVLRQKNNTALYYGLAIPIRNFTRFYNYTGGERLERSVKASVGKTWGKATLDYIDNVLSDLQFGRQTQRGITDTLKSIHAGATLNLNLGIAIKQSASYPFAASVIGWGPLAKAARHVVSKADREYMDSITPWGYMRRTGFSGTEMGEVAKQRTGIDNNRTIQRVKTALDLIRQVDVRTTEVLFFACEEYVKDKYPDLEVRGSEYNRRLADIYNETLQRTQPSYDVMQRNEYLRKQNDIAKIFGAFKTQTFNMGGEVIDAWSRWRAYSEYAKKDISYVNAKKEAGKAFGNTVAATIVAQGMLVILSAAANAVLHRMRDYRDEKGEVTPESIAKKILKDFGTSFAGMTMGGSEAQDFALALLGDGKWYDIDYPGLTLINDFAYAAVEFRKAASKAVETGNKQDLDKASVKMAKLIMQMFKLQGVPAQNVYNIANAVYLWGTDVKNGEAGTFNAGEGLFGLQDTSPTKEQYAKQAIDAYMNGDTAKGDRAAQRASKEAIKKEMGNQQDAAIRFLKENNLGDAVNRNLWEKAGWKLKTYDKHFK